MASERKECDAPPALRNPVEEFVPEAGCWEEPGAAVVEVERGAGKRDLSEGISAAVGIFAAA